MLWRRADFVESDDGFETCTLCPHECRLARGETGRCGLRRHGSGGLETAASVVALRHVDAIERKPFYHFLPGSTVLTLAAPGCTFRCRYCQNYRLSQVGRPEGTRWSGDETDPVELVASAQAQGASVGMSYTEPSLAAELALEIGTAAARAGVPFVWKSNGFLTAAARRTFIPHLAAVNVDVKTFDVGKHEALTGGPLRPVLETIEAFVSAGIWVEITTPLIPKISDDRDTIGAIARWIAKLDPGIPWHLGRFNPDFHMSGYAPTTPQIQANARAVALEAGLHFVYVERGLGPAGRRTLCPRCGAAVLERDVWRLQTNRLESAGTCPACRHELPGRWTAPAERKEIGHEVPLRGCASRFDR